MCPFSWRVQVQLHLFEFTNAEDEVAGGDLVAEALTNLADAERNLLAGGAQDVVEVDKDVSAVKMQNVLKAVLFLLIFQDLSKKSKKVILKKHTKSSVNHLHSQRFVVVYVHKKINAKVNVSVV